MAVPMFARTARGTEPTGHDIQLIDVTPQVAQKLLLANTHNRGLRESTVQKYARDMKNGRWHVNNDVICVATDGTLLNGQHRLTAVIRARVTVKMLVGYGYPPDSQDVMDIQAKRTVGEQLSLHGEKDSTILAAILRFAVIYSAGRRSMRNFKPSDQEMHAYLLAHPEVRQAAAVGGKARRYVPAPPSVIGFAYHVCAAIDPYAADKFYIQQLIEGIDLQASDPARVLHKRLADTRTAKRSDIDETVRLVFYAWNAFRDRKSVTKLQAPRGGWTAENFPEPK